MSKTARLQCRSPVREGKFGKAELVGETGDVFSVNATNNRTLVRSYGKDSDAWVGKEIELHLGEIEYQGSPQPAARSLGPPDLTTTQTKTVGVGKA
jgi:hypothetical protein